MNDFDYTLFHEIEPFLIEKVGNKSNEILELATKRYEELCKENKNEPKALKMHSRKKIYPTIAIFEAIETILGRQVANDIIYDYYEEFSNKTAKGIQYLLKVPGLYKKVPQFFVKATKKTYGEEAGFKTEFLVEDKEEGQFTMTECPYHKITQKYNCEQICGAFCMSDDICYGAMHEKLEWNRTKTLGRGDACCDFHIKVKTEV